MDFENCYLIYEKDFEQQNWIDWIKNHISLAPPPHRFHGQLHLESNRLLFEGKDKYENEVCEFGIAKNSITQIYHGYDETFNKFQTRGFGLSYAPIRLQLESTASDPQNIYLVSNFNGVTSANEQFFEILKKWLL